PDEGDDLLSAPVLDDGAQQCLNQILDLLDLPDVQDVVTDNHGTLWIDWGIGLHKLRWEQLPTPAQLTEVISWLFWHSGRRIDFAFPVADAVFRNRVRVHGVLRPLAPHYPLLSLRKHQHF